MSMKKKGKDELALKKKEEVGFYEAPPELDKLESLKNFIYNPDTGQVLGRTGASWGKICTFYLIFYMVLASVFGIMLWTFYQTLDPEVPRWQLTQSLIGQYPGLGFRPMPNDSETKSTLIWCQGRSNKSYEMYTKTLDKFLEVYKRPGLTPGRGQNIYKCDYDRPPGPGQVCDVDIKNWFPCVSENNFNYHQSSPCIFIKLNKIYGWEADYYNDTTELPDNMPEDLKNHIKEQMDANPEFLKTVWVSCEGEHPIDNEYMGELQYIPRRGFPGYFYPYQNTEGYLSPLVAIHFKRPKTGVIINIECRTWAKNLIHDRKERIGIVHFELLLD